MLHGIELNVRASSSFWKQSASAKYALSRSFVPSNMNFSTEIMKLSSMLRAAAGATQRNRELALQSIHFWPKNPVLIELARLRLF
jgi:hypothetical protein